MVVELGLVLLLAFAPALLSLLLTAAGGAANEPASSLTVGEAAAGILITIFLSWSPLLVLAYLLRRNGEHLSTIGLGRFSARDLGAAVLLLIGSFIVVWALTPVFQGLGSKEVDFLYRDLPLWFTGIQAVLIAVTAGVTEEVLVRGYAQTRLEQLGLPGAVVVLAPTALWSVLHVYQGLAAVAIIFGLGLLWSIYFQRTRRLWPLVVAHILYDLIGLIWILTGS
jgi:membrane protease YdiL (CAAX protease family)